MEVKWCRMNAATSNNRRGIWFKEFTDLWMCAQHIAQVKLNLWYLHKQTNQILLWHTDPNCTLRSWHRTLLQTHTKTNTSRAVITTHTSKNIPHAVHVKSLLFFRSIVILRPALESNLSVHESVWKEKRASHGVLRWEQNWSRHQLVKRPSMIGNKPSQDRTIFSHLCCRKPIAPSSFFPISPSASQSFPAEEISRIPPPSFFLSSPSTCLTTAYFGNQSCGTVSCAGTSQRKVCFSTLAGKAWPIN